MGYSSSSEIEGGRVALLSNARGAISQPSQNMVTSVKKPYFTLILFMSVF